MDGFPRMDSAAAGASLVGKIPARADFVRFGAMTAEAQAFDAWLVRAMERLHLTGRPFPDRLFRFVHRSHARARGAMGVLAPSRDRLGRRFPVAIVLGTGPEGEGAPPQAVSLDDAFLQAAATAASELPALTAERIDPWLAALAAGRAGAASVAAAGPLPELERLGARQFLESAFGPGSHAMQCYGLLTFSRAAQSARVSPANATSPLLDCPVTERASAQVWLELAGRMLPNSGLSFVWSDDAPHRLLLAWGALSDEALCALADPRFSSRTLWPFTTERAAAIERAVATLAQPLQALLRAPDSSVARLPALLSQLQ